MLSIFAVMRSTLSGLFYWSRESGELGPALWGYWLPTFIFLPALVVFIRRPNVVDARLSTSR